MSAIKEQVSKGVPGMDLEAIARQAGDLPAFPGTALAAMQMTEDPNVSLRALQIVISKDQALTARILKIVNSAMYSFEREVSTLSHAIAILGLDTVRSIIVTAAVQQIFQSSGTQAKDLTSKLFWEHSFGAALSAKSLAGLCGYPMPEEAFSCGLLHDMGKMVMLKNQHQQYQAILNQVYCGVVSFCDAEQDVFGFTHAQLGSLLASQWHFPSQLVEAILYHHDCMAAPKYSRLAAITALADAMMASLEIGFRKNPSLKLEEEPSAKMLNMTAPILQKTAAVVQTMMPTLTGGRSPQGTPPAAGR
jgi:HD-like signal output (HDOD) protein